MMHREAFILTSDNYTLNMNNEIFKTKTVEENKKISINHSEYLDFQYQTLPTFRFYFILDYISEVYVTITLNKV